MFKRYDLDVYVNAVCVYNASFSSINHLVKFACGFDINYCELTAHDVVTEKYLPIDRLCEEFRSDTYGI